MQWNVYLSGEIHTDWREEIIQLCKKEDLNIKFSSPVTNHDASDNCGVEILGNEEKNFWKDRIDTNLTHTNIANKTAIPFLKKTESATVINFRSIRFNNFF